MLTHKNLKSRILLQKLHLNNKNVEYLKLSNEICKAIIANAVTFIWIAQGLLSLAYIGSSSFRSTGFVNALTI